jgi:tellurite resistance protein
VKRVTIGVRACSEALSLLISVAWSDGRLDDGEKEGVRAAAEKLNLPRETRSLVDLLIEKPKPAAEIKFQDCSERDKAFGFAAASWMARVDGKLDPKEAELLKTVGDAIGLSEARRAELTALVEGLTPAPASDKGKWSDHIDYLFQAILPRIAQSGQVATISDDDVAIVVE